MIRWLTGPDGILGTMDVQISDDRTEWETLSLVSTSTPEQWEELSVEVSGRFVRFYFRNPEHLDQIGGLAEVEVWGLLAEPTPTAEPVQVTDTPTATVTEVTSAPPPTVTPEPPPAENQPPVAHAGPDQNLTDVDGQGYVLTAVMDDGSSDPDGSITQYEWYVDGVWVATDMSQMVAIPLGQHSVVLIVTDNQDATASDELIVTVEQADPVYGALYVQTIDANGAVITGACYSLFVDLGGGTYNSSEAIAQKCDHRDEEPNDGTTHFTEIPVGPYVVVQSVTLPGYTPANDQQIYIYEGGNTVVMQQDP